jgi:hypothetical protein
VHHGFGLLPSIRNALRHATIGAGHVAAAAAGGSTVLFVVFCALLFAGGFLVLVPLARHLHHRHLRRAG